MKNIKGFKKEGFVFITVLIFSCVLIFYAAVSIKLAVSEIHFAGRNLVSIKGLYTAEAGIEQAIHDIAQYIVTNFEDPPDPPSLDAITGEFTIMPGIKGVYTCQSIGAERTIVDEVTGVVTYEQNYLLTCTSKDAKYGDVMKIHQLMGRQKSYAFQFAIFYADDLEVFPGRCMTFGGKVHSNGDIYIGADGDSTVLTIDSEYLRTASEIYGYRKNNGNYLNGDVSIKVANSGGSYALMKEIWDGETLDSDRDDWMDESQIRWNGTVKSRVHNVGTLAHPLVASIQPGGFYAQRADIHVKNGSVFKGDPTDPMNELIDGVDIPVGTITTISGTDIVPGAHYYNNREGKYIKITDIDLRKLAGYAPGDVEGAPSYNNYFPENGLMYATRDDIPIDMQGGIRLYNGAEIYCQYDGPDPVGICLVSNLPVYILGDFNIDDTAGGFEKKPCSIMCDAANLLSNNWVDANSTGGQAARRASETEINLAMLSGVDVTTPGHYNGGLENYPRLHEDWSGIDLNIKGSFIQLWNSQVAQGPWIYGTSGSTFYYTAPIRNWYYDNSFNNTDNLPPYTPFVVGTIKKAWWVE